MPPHCRHSIYNGPAISLASLTIDLTGAGNSFNRLSVAGNTASVSGADIVALNGRGSFSQTGGTSSADSTTSLLAPLEAALVDPFFTALGHRLGL